MADAAAAWYKDHSHQRDLAHILCVVSGAAWQVLVRIRKLSDRALDRSCYHFIRDGRFRTDIDILERNPGSCFPLNLLRLFFDIGIKFPDLLFGKIPDLKA